MDYGITFLSSTTSNRSILRELAQAADELGYHSVWVGEHIAMPRDYRSTYPYSTDGQAEFPYDSDFTEAMVTLGFIAGVTDRVRLGTSVIPMITRDPLSMAKQAATVDRLSDGRLELGLGAGWCRDEAELLGHPHDHSAERMDEAIEIMRCAWSQPSFTFSGRFWSYPEVYVNPKPVQGRDVPIWIGGLGPKAVRTRIEHATGNLVYGGPDEVRLAAEKLRADRKDLRLWAPVGRGDDMVERAKALCSAGADLPILACPATPADLTSVWVADVLRD